MLRSFRLSVIALTLAASPALAQPAPAFTPFTVSQQDAAQLRSYLDDQPMKFSLPVLQWLIGLENKAAEKAKADAKAAPAKKTAPVPVPGEKK